MLEIFTVKPGAKVTVAVTTAAGTGVISAELGFYMRVVADAACHFAVADVEDAALTASTGALLPANHVEYVYVPRGKEIKFFGGAAEADVWYNKV